MQLNKGTTLHGGTYRIEQVLGQGTFGITYLAEHVNLGKKVAIKEFFMKEINSRSGDGSITGMTDSSLSQNYCHKFQKEAINLSRLDHPNIVRVTDSFSENGTYYYVMDYIEGDNINDYIKTHRISVKRATEIIQAVADALIYMHEEKHMLHLDLKPGNVMRRTSDGHIFLIDFGLSKHFDKDGQPETSTNIGLGTAGYAPIEQGDRAKNGDFRSTIDVYALGATYYKLLTGETPPAASELIDDEKLLTSSLRRKGVPEPICYVVKRAMAPSAKRRTQSIREFLDLLSVSLMTSQKTTTAIQATTSDEATIVSSKRTAEEPAPPFDNKTHRNSYKKIFIFVGVIIVAFFIGLRIGPSIKTAPKNANLNHTDTVYVDKSTGKQTNTNSQKQNQDSFINTPEQVIGYPSESDYR